MTAPSGELFSMNSMRAIYVRSLFFVLGFAALLLIEQITPPPHGDSATPTAVVGSGHSPA